ncbi:PhzA/PhzB family protein [Pseudomonas aeruginosa]
MLDNAIPQGFEDAVELRRKNRETVVKYMNTKGQDRLRRHELFVEDGCGGLWTTDTGSPIVIRGKDKLAEHAVWSLKCFPDWEWYNIKVFETDDPNHFWVECDGHGKIPPGYCLFELCLESVEFWGNGTERLHERLRYDRDEGGWKHRYLQP